MIPGTLIDLVPFEDVYATYLPEWMNTQAWLRARVWERYAPHAEHQAEKFIEEMEKKDNAKMVGIQAKNGDPIGAVAWERQWVRMRKTHLWFFAGDPRYEGTDELLDGLLMAVHYNFATRNLHRLGTVVLAFDEAKIDHLQRAGFSHEGTLRQHLRWAGDYVDLLTFGLLETEWPGYEEKVQALNLQASDIPPKPTPEKTEQSSDKDKRPKD